MINKESLGLLISECSSSKDMLDIICDALVSFEEYHNKIYEMETKMKVYSSVAIGREEYQNMVSELDKTRTMYHNGVLANLNVLNRLAEKIGIKPIYDGVISTEAPYRRIAANDVIDYVEEIIKKRR